MRVPWCVALLVAPQAGEYRTKLGSGLRQLGLGPGCTVGLYSINCAPWVLLDAACHAHGMVSVPLYDTLGGWDLLRSMAWAPSTQRALQHCCHSLPVTVPGGSRARIMSSFTAVSELLI